MSGEIWNWCKKHSKKIAVGAGALPFIPPIIDSCIKIAEKDKPVRDRTLKYFGIGVLVVGGGYCLCKFWRRFDKKQDHEHKCDEIDAKAEADIKVIKARAEANMMQHREKAEIDIEKHERMKAIKAENDVQEEKPSTNRMPWEKMFNRQMPPLPPFLDKIMKGVPDGCKNAMLLHLLAILGALCFSKIRARFSDSKPHAPNLQVVIEAPYASGKSMFEHIFKTLFSRVIDSDKAKINNGGNSHIIQTTGIGVSMPKYMDFLSQNQECHMFMFSSEIRELANDMKRANGLSTSFLCKAFENGDICSNNKSSNSTNGIFRLFLNTVFTGTRDVAEDIFGKELENGTVSRICWTSIPPQGRTPSNMTLPNGAELKHIQDQIDQWREKYCYSSTGGKDTACKETEIDLDYVCKALGGWVEKQYDISFEENNPARRDLRTRIATIAFHCAEVLQMLYSNKKDESTQKQVVDLTLYIAEYCMARSLWRWGGKQNALHKKMQEAGLEEADSPSNTTIPETRQSELITDIAELYCLHQIKDEKGNNKYGWDTLAKLSGIPESTLRRKVAEYEKRLKSGC